MHIYCDASLDMSRLNGSKEGLHNLYFYGEIWKIIHKLVLFTEEIKLFSCSTQLSMRFFLLINVKMPTIASILTLMSGKNSILGLSEPEKCRIS